eukprot:GHRQ01015170.1.p1 GENE.GHRQ01015170.1~~GHRQ01015170.1.p1  ORF type:complete len:281 (+),score=82.48 GHRQ01015170.1:552-1394(+)
MLGSFAQHTVRRCRTAHCQMVQDKASQNTVSLLHRDPSHTLDLHNCFRAELSCFALQRTGNILMSYNNRPATDAIPFLSPILSPSARAVGPLLEQLATSPLRSGLETVSDALRGVSPSLMRQLMPVFDQLTPIYMDVAQGRQEFSPTPQETAQLLRNYYAVSRNLILKFKDDTIDDSMELTQLLQSSAAISSCLDLSLRTLDGDHVRPMTQSLPDLPPEVARVANEAAATGGQMLGRLADMANQMGVAGASGPLADLSKGVSSMAGMLTAEVRRTSVVQT